MQASENPIVFCRDCGSKIDAKAEICPKCGVRQWGFFGPGRNRILAALFALLLGGFGVHKFYLGQIGWGIVYLIFFWTLIPAIVGFIEGLILLTRSDAEFNDRYNKNPR